MANTDAPRGFINPKSKTGGSPSVRQYPKTAAIIYPGDIVVFDGSGNVASGTTGAEATEVPMGVAATYQAAADSYVLVYDDLVNTSFEVQVDDNSITAADIGTLIDVLYTAGDTTRKTSKHQLNGDASTRDTTRILELIVRPDNDNALTNNKVRVEFNVFSQAGRQTVTA